MIADCEVCGRQTVPVAKVNSFACEAVACFICQGDIADPYGEIELAQRLDEADTEQWCDFCGLPVKGACGEQSVANRCRRYSARPEDGFDIDEADAMTHDHYIRSGR